MAQTDMEELLEDTPSRPFQVGDLPPCCGECSHQPASSCEILQALPGHPYPANEYHGGYKGQEISALHGMSLRSDAPELHARLMDALLDPRCRAASPSARFCCSSPSVHGKHVAPQTMTQQLLLKNPTNDTPTQGWSENSVSA